VGSQAGTATKGTCRCTRLDGGSFEHQRTAKASFALQVHGVGRGAEDILRAHPENRWFGSEEFLSPNVVQFAQRIGVGQLRVLHHLNQSPLLQLEPTSDLDHFVIGVTSSSI
jgi:hypothetical protein